MSHFSTCWLAGEAEAALSALLAHVDALQHVQPRYPIVTEAVAEARRGVSASPPSVIEIKLAGAVVA
jgi:hypothetical protein